VVAARWTGLPQTRRDTVIHTLGQIVVRLLRDADGREASREDT
jgi:hypothetical protein